MPRASVMTTLNNSFRHKQRMSYFTCPDCQAKYSVDKHGSQIVDHAKECLFGMGEELVAVRDKEWFLAHPFADEYRRPMTEVEAYALAVHMELDPTQWKSGGGRVKVRKLDNEVRVRDFGEVHLIPVVDADQLQMPDYVSGG